MYFPYYTYMVIIFFEQDFDRFQQIALSRIHLYVSKNVYMSFLESQQELESSKKHTETILYRTVLCRTVVLFVF